MSSNANEISLYFHIPFCSRKCDYCHFFVLPDKDPLKKQLLEGLEKEWAMRLPILVGKKLVSVYFGGGTPTLWGPDPIATVMRWIRNSPLILDSNMEVTIEANPDKLTAELAACYADCGINRMSIGVQSLDDRHLLTLSREHNAAAAVAAVNNAYSAGISNISIDLMYDLPGQSLQSWNRTLQQAVKLPITHLSLYNLTIEPHTVFFKKQNELKKTIPNEDTSLEMYEGAISAFAEHGLKQYEISAFARDDKISRHNCGYWLARPFLGFGPSAFSYWEGSRFSNVSHLGNYCKALEAGKLPVDFEETLSDERHRRELLVVQIRLVSGVNLTTFQALHGPLDQETLTTIERLGSIDLLASAPDSSISLTRRGILLYNSVAAELV